MPSLLCSEVFQVARNAAAWVVGKKAIQREMKLPARRAPTIDLAWRA